MATKSLNLNSKEREIRGQKVKHLRNEGMIPAILYGSGVKDSLLLTLNYKEFDKVYSEGGENTLVKLSAGGDETYNVVIHGVDKDPVSQQYTHVDFYAVNMAEKIASSIPLVFDGISDAVKNLGGVLVKAKDELEIESLPADMPGEIIVPIANLRTFDDIIRVKDLKLPAGVSVLAEDDEAIALVTPPRTEEELAADQGPVEAAPVEGAEPAKEGEAAAEEAPKEQK